MSPSIDVLLETLLLPSEEEIANQADYRDCGCAYPKPMLNYHGALGTAQVIHLCCIAKLLQEQFPDHRLLEVIGFQPSWEWDCDALLESGKRRGCPPSWLEKRLKEKGVQIKSTKHSH